MRQDAKDREHDRMRRFEERWREWSRRPPRQNPSQAAHRVITRLDEVSRVSTSDLGFGSWTSRLLAATALVALAAGLWLLLPGLPLSLSGPDSQTPDPGVEATETPVMADGVVLIMLDDETPLYMTFAPPQGEPGAGKGEGS